MKSQKAERMIIIISKEIKENKLLIENAKQLNEMRKAGGWIRYEEEIH